MLSPPLPAHRGNVTLRLLRGRSDLRASEKLLLRHVGIIVNGRDVVGVCSASETSN